MMLFYDALRCFKYFEVFFPWEGPRNTGYFTRIKNVSESPHLFRAPQPSHHWSRPSRVLEIESDPP